MIRKNFLQLVFSGAYLWRWNDKLRPAELSEIEKQAHKMLVACVLWNEYSRNLPVEQAVALGAQIVEGALFDYFYRLIITDIKPPVFYKIRENRKHYRELTQFALDRLEPVLSSLGPFWERMKTWHLQEDADEEIARRILTAAHLYASQWEYKLIRPFNHMDDEMEGIGRSFDEMLARFEDLPGMKDLQEPGSALAKFANLCGQLRFQIRWTQAPRIPATSVLGHMFIVAACAYMFTYAANGGQARANNNFFSGIFHDFPEVLTRDIISPVKRSISGLSELVREYEEAELERRVLAPLRASGFEALTDRISWYLGLEIGSEFQDCCRVDGAIVRVKDFDGMKIYDRDEYDPRDGQLLKTCDLLAAFLEAHNSIRNGVSSPHLLEARSRLKTQIMEKAPDCLRLEGLLADFD